MFFIHHISNNLLLVLLVLPLIGALNLIFIPNWNFHFLRLTALFYFFATFVGSLFLPVGFSQSLLPKEVQLFCTKLSWVPDFDINLILKVDEFSLFLLLLTTLLVPLYISVSWDNIKDNAKEYLVSFLFMESFLIAVFSFPDLMVLYVLFESFFIPMFLIIAIVGSQEKKTRAYYLLILYILIGLVLIRVEVAQSGIVSLLKEKSLIFGAFWLFNCMSLSFLFGYRRRPQKQNQQKVKDKD